MESKFTSLPQNTLKKVEEFVASQMHPTNDLTGSTTVATESGNHGQTRTKYIPKFTVDGYGRWREVHCLADGKEDLGVAKTKNIILHDVFAGLDIKCDSTSDRGFSQTSSYTSRSRNSHASERKTSKNSQANIECRETPETAGTQRGYIEELSNSLRYNTFPGIGKSQWESSTKETYVPKSIPSQWLEPQVDFAVKKDALMKWAEYDVYRKRLKKAWDKYMADAPKTERQAPVQRPRKEIVEETKAKRTVKSKKQKAATKQDDKEAEPPKISEPEPRRIEVLPAKSDDSFWDFYEKPFPVS